MENTPVIFHSGQLFLEGELAIPKDKGPLPAVIICHPHPLYGGNMDNNVVNSLSEALTQSSLISFKFNFRGVGRSEGDFSQGIGEQQDVISAISFLTMRKEVDSNRIGLVGYSAGATFAFPVASSDSRVKALAAVSPPLPMFDFEFIKGYHKPKLFISGSTDDLIHASNFLEFCQNLSEPKEYHIIEGADHFWYGFVSDLSNKVAAFFTRLL